MRVHQEGEDLGRWRAEAERGAEVVGGHSPMIGQAGLRPYAGGTPSGMRPDGFLDFHENELRDHLTKAVPDHSVRAG
ncbi:hypothetical protein Acsp02_73680 [Actinoplanes sp. NBRC 103695]|nr:hypothetical protein Acsp02_73680 [Actinoplanes sp. NBRC 103695]